MTGCHWELPPPSAGGLCNRGWLSVRWTWAHQELTNLLFLASALFLASLYSDNKEIRPESCVGCCDFSVRQEYVGVWSCSGCKCAFEVMGSWHVCSIAASETWAFKWLCSRQGQLSCLFSCEKERGTDWATFLGGMRETSSDSSVLWCRVTNCCCSSPRLC